MTNTYSNNYTNIKKTKNNENGNRELVGTQPLGLLFLDQLGVWEKTGDWHVHKLLLLMLFQAWQAQPDVPVPHMISTHGEATKDSRVQTFVPES